LEKQKRELTKQNSVKDIRISDLTKEVERLKSLLNIDGTNSGLSTSNTPINKKKVIPNSRKKTGRKIGGQFGHVKKNWNDFPTPKSTHMWNIPLTNVLLANAQTF
jgi:transposase